MIKYHTSESVTEGHPDKVCDKISDCILDAILAKDKEARVACETYATTGCIIVGGQVTTNCFVDIPTIVKEVLTDIGYTRGKYGFDADNCGILTAIEEQSPDIWMGVRESLESKEGDKDEFDAIGAGDQGMMFGFASDETPEYMPLAISLAHKLTKRLAEIRKDGTLDYILPDGKAQVTIMYEDNVPKKVTAVVVSTQHKDSVDIEDLRRDVKREVIDFCIPKELMDENTKIYINPTGRFVVGGPKGDVGLTGRKIIVDTYGGYAHHGGGAFSGKDPTKVDRSAAYAARHVAKNVVASGLAKECEVALSYAIGVARPTSIDVNCNGTETVSLDEIRRKIEKVFDLRPAAIIKNLDLRRPIYGKTTNYGHFGREDADFTWEKLDKIEELKNA
ncbi:MAG: methionine adenosyltransferase [Ezakiella sp.]|nr:methionine adenosyltransferase [Ezakiella sp.]MDD7472087.1 methionine adenosyltransferase [Bacillota bacterium]MDY3924050.1 methionine adenosyltransferase [Ezakiella sp.]